MGMEQMRHVTEGAQPRLVKHQNRKLVLNELRNAEVLSISELSDRLNLSRQTIMKVLDYFIDREMVVSVGKGESTEQGGKKPENFSCQFTQQMLAILIHPDETIFYLTDMKSHVLDQVELPVRRGCEFSEWRQVLEQGCSQMKVRHPELESALYGISLAYPGVASQSTGSLRQSIYFQNWPIDIPIGDILKELFPTVSYVYINNIGKIAGASALWKNPDTFMNKRILTLYTRIGVTACFLSSGRIIEGVNAMIGQVGHMVLDPTDLERCPCGGYGCLERLVSLKRIQERVAEQLDQYPDSTMHGLDLSSMTFDQLFEQSEQGDALARLEVGRIAKLFGHLVRNTCLSFDPEVILFQGVFSSADSHFNQTLMNTLRDFLYFPEDGKVQILYDRQSLTDLELLGSVQVLVQQFFNDDQLYSG